MAFYSTGGAQRHKAFISFYNEDERYKNDLENNYHSDFVSKSVQYGDIDPNETNVERVYQNIRDNYIADATVTIVLIGNGTWRRKYVDWEIYSSLRDTKNNSRTGLLGILLPTYASYGYSSWQTSDNMQYYNPHAIPPRLYDNIANGFAKIYSWSSINNLNSIIHDAFNRRNTLPNNSRETFTRNRTTDQLQWS